MQHTLFFLLEVYPYSLTSRNSKISVSRLPCSCNGICRQAAVFHLFLKLDLFCLFILHFLCYHFSYQITLIIFWNEKGHWARFHFIMFSALLSSSNRIRFVQPLRKFFPFKEQLHAIIDYKSGISVFIGDLLQFSFANVKVLGGFWERPHYAEIGIVPKTPEYFLIMDSLEIILLATLQSIWETL